MEDLNKKQTLYFDLKNPSKYKKKINKCEHIQVLIQLFNRIETE